MRTTVTIDDVLLDQVKVLAARTRRTVSAIVEDGLRDQVQRARVGVGTTTFDLPVSGHPGGRPLIDLYDKDALAEALDDAPRGPETP